MAGDGNRLGYTLVEILVVIAIMGLVTVLIAPAIFSALGERPVIGAADLIRGEIEGARARAINEASPAGIRLLRDGSIAPVAYLADGAIDPASSLACNRVIPLSTPPAYMAGSVSLYPGWAYPTTVTSLPCLVVEESPGTWVQSGGAWTFIASEPTAWGYNLRVGERIAIKGAPLWIVGPVAASNEERSVNSARYTRIFTAPDGVTQVSRDVEYLLCVNGHDDDGDGFADDGFDGIDNNGDGLTDDAAEWEAETLPTQLARGGTNMAYLVTRRPAPSPGGVIRTLSSGAVVDLTTWATTRERSRLPVDPMTGSVDLVFDEAGRSVLASAYSTPAAMGMDTTWLHLWVASRSDVADPLASTAPPLLPMPKGSPGAVDNRTLAGARRVVSINTRTGRVTVSSVETFSGADPLAPLRSVRQD